ncbi:hypothetical protein Patl1_06540 [Pistacia atlantica]|uniref:Uncharacterized protein n=1 Tax=Pistacia atlantica TaxID=434234 RepID=A0ACC1BTV9_9ROSI|nr:hypothetical protein Patl1_06540 [Pistacia atlantica]
MSLLNLIEEDQTVRPVATTSVSWPPFSANITRRRTKKLGNIGPVNKKLDIGRLGSLIPTLALRMARLIAATASA